MTTTTVEVTFSESVSDTTLAVGDFVFAGFTTVGANGGPSGLSSGAADDEVVTLTLQAADRH